MRKLFTTSLLLIMAAGCESVSVSDDLDIDFDFLTLSGSSGELHSPYVQGATMTLYVHTSDDDDDLTGWHVDSSDPSLFHIDSEAGSRDVLSVEATAAGDGVATLIVYDGGGHERARREVESRFPDRVQLSAYGPILIGRAEQAPVDELRLVGGGTATYLVNYWYQGRLLAGHGVLSAVVAAADVIAEPRTTFLWEDREWLTVTAPQTAGASTIELFVDGEAAATFPLQTVPESDIIRIAIEGEDETEASHGDWLVALAQAFDGQDRRVYGVEYQWSVDGLVEEGAGDIYRYEFQPKAPRALDATFGGMSASATIHAGEGVVDSTNNIGCAAAPGRTGASGPIGLLLVVGLTWIRHRRA